MEDAAVPVHIWNRILVKIMLKLKLCIGWLVQQSIGAYKFFKILCSRFSRSICLKVLPIIWVSTDNMNLNVMRKLPSPESNWIQNYFLTSKRAHIVFSMVQNVTGGVGLINLYYYFGGGQCRWEKLLATLFIFVGCLVNNPRTSNLILQSITKLLNRPCVTKYTKSENRDT